MMTLRTAVQRIVVLSLCKLILTGTFVEGGLIFLSARAQASATMLTVAAVSGRAGQSAPLAATLSVDGAPVSGKTITFQIDGQASGAATTNVTGTASLSFVLPGGLSVGNHALVAAFAGDSQDAPAQGINKLTVAAPLTTPTSLIVFNAIGNPGQLVNLIGRLRAAGTATGYLPGKKLTFLVDGWAVDTVKGTIQTDATGFAVDYYSAPLSLTPGYHTLNAAFAGDSNYTASTAAAILTVKGSPPTAAIPPNLGAVYNGKIDPALPAHVVGDGVTDDLPALNAIVSWMTAGHPGVLYLPTGNYFMVNSAGAGLHLRSGVALYGDGPGRTTLTGNGNSTGTGCLVVIDQAANAGLYELSLVNNAPPVAAPYTPNTFFENCVADWGNCSGITFQHISWALGHGNRLFLENINGLTLTNCTFDASQALNGFLSVSGSMNLSVTGNTFNYATGRLEAIGCTGLIDSNSLTWPAGPQATPILTEIGGIEFNFSHGLTISNNHIGGSGTVDDLSQNDREAILSQNAQATSGGPDAARATHDVTISGNTLTTCRGIEIYNGGANCSVTGNTLTNAGGILLRGFSDSSAGTYYPIVNCTVTDNTISNPSGAALSFVAETAIALGAPSGPLLTGNIQSGNILTPHVPAAGIVPDAPQGVTSDSIVGFTALADAPLLVPTPGRFPGQYVRLALVGPPAPCAP